jgi:hypothetical protein
VLNRELPTPRAKVRAANEPNSGDRGRSIVVKPYYEQPCVTIHFTWKQDWPAVSKLLPVIEKELAPFQARPHWGKLFTTQKF